MARADELRGAARRRRRTPPTSGHGPPPPPRPTLGTIPTLEAAPGQRAAAQAGARAQRATPAPVVPHIPIIANPTQRQITAAKQATAATVRQHAKATGQTPAAAAEDLRRDPRARQFVRAANHYARVDEQRTAERAGTPPAGAPALYPTADIAALSAAEATRAAHPGVERALTRAQRIRAGRALIAGHERAGPGRTPTKVRLGVGPVSLATINATAVSRALAGATTLGTGDIGPRSAFGKVASDVKTLGEAPFIGGYQVGAAAVEGLKKHPALALGTLPGALVAAATTPRGQRLAKGVAQGYAQEAQHPLKYAGEHPLLFALDVSGAASVLGRGAGAVARAGALGRRVKDAATTVRSPIALTDEPGSALIERSYSKDVVRKGFQVASDSRREPVRDAQGNVVTVERLGKRVPVLKPHGEAEQRVLGRLSEQQRMQRGEANFVASRTNAQERVARVKATRAGRVQGVRGGVRTESRLRQPRARPLEDLVAAATTGTITSGAHFAEDLRTYRDRVSQLVEADKRAQASGKGERHYTTEADRKLAEENVRYFDAVLRSPKALEQADRIVAQGEAHGRRLNTVEQDLIDRKVGLDPEQARRRRMLEVATGPMGGRHFTVAEHARMEREATQVENAARERVASAAPADKAAAEAELRTAREHRIAVSGRDPARVVSHERAAATHRQAERNVETLRKRVYRLEKRRSEIVGSQATRRGKRRFAGLDQKATRAERNKLARAEAEIQSAKGEVKAAREHRAKMREELDRNPLPETNAGIRTAEGKFLSTKDIEDFLRQRGRDPESVAYLPHRGDVLGRRAYHRQNRPGARPDIGATATTGEAYRKGHATSSAQVLQDQGVRQSTILEQAKAQDRMVGDYGLRHPAWTKAQAGEALTKAEQRIVDRGGYFDGPEAAEVIRRAADRGEHLVAVRAFPSRLDKAAQDIVREHYQGPGGLETLPQRLFNDRILTGPEAFSSRARNVTVMPGHFIDTLNAHLKPSQGLDKFFQALNKPFRYAVLPQFRWLTGNFVEPYVVRLTTVGSGLNVFGLGVDIAAGRKTLRAMERSKDPKVRAAAAEIHAHQMGGLFVGGGERRGVRRTGGELGGPAAWGAYVRHLPVIKQMADLVTMPLHAFFNVNYYIERGAQHAGFGHQIRQDVAEFSGSWWKSVLLGRKATDEAARGLVNTSTQRRFMRAQHVLLGKYEGFPPWLRRMVQGVAPFLPWALNAARFVYWTMPAHHSALTSVLVKTNDVVKKDWDQIHSDVPPGSLKLAVPTKNGGWLDLARYTPYGLTGPVAEGEYESLIHEFAPQLSGAVSAIEGRDPFGRDLSAPPTPANPRGRVQGLQKLAVALNTTVEGLVPYIAQLRRLREGGSTPYSTSTLVKPQTKPGTKHGSGVGRTFFPFNPTYLRSHGGGAVPTAGPPLTRQQQILVRAAERSGVGGLSDRQLQLLERAARRAAGG